MDDTNGLHGKQFAELLPLAIQADMLSSTPRTLGNDAPQGENRDLESLSVIAGSVPITINGVSY